MKAGMDTGLTEADLQQIRTACSHYPEIEEVVLFGSRAKGTYKTGSDIDIAIKGKAVTLRTVTSLLSELEDSSLPYFVDVVPYHSTAHPALIEHIDRAGVVL